jgi:hypothetical protein
MSYVPSGHLPEGHLPEGHLPDESSSSAPDVRFDFRSRRATRRFPAIVSDTEYTFAPAVKDPAESLKVRLDLFGQCANFWAANEQFSQGEYARPNRPNGYSYEATTAGTSGYREPIWPQTLGRTVQDGSVVWTCREASTNGLAEITSPSASPDPTGLTIADVSVSELTKILATYSGGSEGDDYDAVFTFTLNGVTRVARQTVQVRKQ